LHARAALHARALLKIEAPKIAAKFGAFHARGACASDERARLKIGTPTIAANWWTCSALSWARSSAAASSSCPPISDSPPS
jgi:hypothetical protein